MDRFDLLLALPLYAANASLLLIMRLKLLGPLHALDRPVSRRLFGGSKTWLGLALIFLIVTLGYVYLLGSFSLLPAAGFAVGVHASSYIKRKLSMKESQPFPFLDQLDFFAGGAAGLALCGTHFSDLASVAVLTFLVHLASNVFSHRVGIKDVWW